MDVNAGHQDNLQTFDDAWQLFANGDFNGALAAFVDSSHLLSLNMAEFELMIELLTDREEYGLAACQIERSLESLPDDATESHPEQIKWKIALSDLLRRSGQNTRAFAAGLEAIEMAAPAWDYAEWTSAIHKGWIDDIEATAQTPREMLSILEQVAFAPRETGLPASVARRIEEIGHAQAGDTGLARDVEVLLHALGESTAAYRVELSRRSAREPHASAPRGKQQRPLFSLAIVIAGGHPALRSVIARTLLNEGARSVGEIPSAHEANRGGRDVQATLVGTDLAVILVRQIAHSTSDQVRRAAEKLEIPVVISESSGSAGVRRAIERWRSP